ncbi:MAG TPA: hypothetical protein VF230_13105 [Acidimicrobiales bacterium]
MNADVHTSGTTVTAGAQAGASIVGSVCVGTFTIDPLAPAPVVRPDPILC